MTQNKLSANAIGPHFGNEPIEIPPQHRGLFGASVDVNDWWKPMEQNRWQMPFELEDRSGDQEVAAAVARNVPILALGEEFFGRKAFLYREV